MRYVLDASGSMRARFGETTRFGVAAEVLRALDARLARERPAPQPTLWAYGARSHRLQRDCSDAALASSGRAGLPAALDKLAPRGVSPLVHALEGLLAAGGAPRREAWVLFTDGGDTCQQDPCAWVERALARAPRPRIYVVGLGLEPGDARTLRCLTTPTSGYLLDLDPAEAWQPAIARLAAVIADRGTLRVELAAPGGAPVDLQGRLFREGESEPLRSVRAGRQEELPGGMYRLVLETLPPTTVERVLILPGEERVVRVDDVGAIRVRALTPENELLPAYAAIAPAAGGDAERYVAAGREVLVRPGAYRVTVEVGDSVALRETIEIERGELRELTTGGTGWVRARAGGLAAPALDLELQAYGPGPARVLRPWLAAVRVPAGEYRAVVRSLPLFVEEGFTVAPAETTALVLSGLGSLRVELRDGAGRRVRAPVTLLRPQSDLAEMAEPAPGAVLGTFTSGEAQVVLEGTYDLLVDAEPAFVERGVRVQRGSERTVRLELGGPADSVGPRPAVAEDS
ncbi:MAG: hypothetical protein ABR599_02225 [Gemmatimonadota bacterium]